MSSSARQDWSDEDEDGDVARIETSVHLGIPDGPVDSASDLKDAAVSRIGGQPALLSHEVPFDSSLCRHCKNPMELLVQLWAPFEDSPYDRAVYVWGCARSGCQGKNGSIRAWRGLRYNETYAPKLERKLARKRVHERSPLAPLEGHKSMHQTAKINPFAMSTEVPHSGLGTDVFNSVTPLDPGAEVTFQGSVRDQENVDHDDDSASTSSSVSSVVVALASATVADSSWLSAPLYLPQYLSTVDEYIPPSNKAPDEPTTGHDDDDGFNQEGHPWASEQYENSVPTDHIFDRFNERAAHQPQQCVRYDLGGIPMPFASDDLYKQLFPLSPEGSASTTVTRAAFNVQYPPPGRGYNAASIPSCPHCGSRRVFEYQLMPNLINLLGRDSTTRKDVTTTDEQRMVAIQRLLKGDPDRRGMEWGTVLVFSCEKDCCPGPGNKEKQGAWAEETVLVHWEK